MADPSAIPESVPSAGDRLDSWKEIAAYLKRDERTVRRWEKSEGLPVHRHTHARQASVYAYKAELDAWWNNGRTKTNGNGHAAAESSSARRFGPNEAPRNAPHEGRAAPGDKLGVRTFAAAAVLVGVLVAAVKLASIAPGASAPGIAVSASNAPRRIAVLPFRNVSGKPADAFIGLALARTIPDQLSYLPSLAPREPAELVNYSSATAAPVVAARELRANLVLVGSYTLNNRAWLVTAELHDAESQAVVWRRDFSASDHGLASLSRVIAEDVGAALHLRARFEPRDPENAAGPEAQWQYLQAVEAYQRMEFAQALRLLDAALATHRDFGPAVALKAQTITAALYDPGAAPQTARLDEAVALHRKAIALGASSPALLSINGLRLMEMGRLDAAFDLLREAVRANPEFAEAHYWLSQAYRYAGLLQESVKEAEVALRLDPGAREYSTLNAYLYLRRYDEFLAKMPRDLTGARSNFYRGLAFYSQGHTAHAAKDFARAIELDASLVHSRFGAALLHAARNETQKGLTVMRGIEKLNQADGEMRFKTAQCFAALGDHASALTNLRRAIDAQFVCHDCFAHDPLLAPLRTHPEFAALLQQARNKQQLLRPRLP